ncbi:protein kinase C and casein kinase substrate in neurons protein [Mytilus galloprovincialis]|uniref:Protein kinase C and casein kinase substrate in neurons protein n=2 Tax=Mytilus galloprovincialis TaxID=29158 RepID=A0A8B6CA66_MYTGA|nr:protein kinase C and casein kinase substrate in neurons protein [Mytilus galloprovincialis]
MSIHDEMTATSDSFWEIGKYSRTVKRCDNGYKLCDNLRQLIEQRAEIEKGYSKNLLGWTKKWNDFLDKGPEYGTTQAMWRGLLEESNSTAELHTVVAENLMQKVYQGIKSWQKENYHKSMMHYKETKEFDDGFKKAQKPWEKKYTKVMSNRKDYHNACKAEKSTANQVNNMRSDDSVALDTKKKMEERLSKCQQEVAGLKDKYEASLNDINNYNAKYIEDMTEIFQKCQEFEKKRIEFFKSTFYDIHQCLDLSVVPQFPQIYTDLHNVIGKTDSDQDLRWWSNNNGSDMAMNWPQFEEYSPDLQSISKKERKSQLHSNDGITITSIRHKGEFAPASPNAGGYNRQSSNKTNDSDNGRKNSIGIILPRNPSVGPLKPQRSPSLHKQSENRTKPEGAPSSLVDKNETRPIPEGQNRSPPTPAKRTLIRNQSGSSIQQKVEYDESLNPFGDDDEDENDKVDDEKNNQRSSYPQPSYEPEPELDEPTEQTYNGRTYQPEQDSNPFGNEDTGSEDSPKESPRLADPVLVRAVFDYEAVEQDEFSFKCGEEFYKLSEEDELGWCKGRKADGEEKLYPANYVKPVSEL